MKLPLPQWLISWVREHDLEFARVRQQLASMHTQLNRTTEQLSLARSELEDLSRQINLAPKPLKPSEVLFDPDSGSVVLTNNVYMLLLVPEEAYSPRLKRLYAVSARILIDLSNPELWEQGFSQAHPKMVGEVIKEDGSERMIIESSLETKTPSTGMSKRYNLLTTLIHTSPAWPFQVRALIGETIKFLYRDWE